MCVSLYMFFSNDAAIDNTIAIVISLLSSFAQTYMK